MLSRLGRAANAFDTFADLVEDYKSKQSRVKPNISNRLLFLLASANAFLTVASDLIKSRRLPSKELVRKSLKAVIWTWGYRKIQ